MADYKKMYLTALDAIERAMALLEEAEQTCEELYVQTCDEENAPKLQQNRYRITGFTNDRVKGTVNAQKDSVLFLSILDNPGWKVRIDGRPVSKIRDTDLAFTGVRVSA